MNKHIRPISMYAAVHVLTMCCFIVRSVIEDEAGVADASKKLSKMSVGAGTGCQTHSQMQKTLRLFGGS